MDHTRRLLGRLSPRCGAFPDGFSWDSTMVFPWFFDGFSWWFFMGIMMVYKWDLMELNSLFWYEKRYDMIKNIWKLWIFWCVLSFFFVAYSMLLILTTSQVLDSFGGFVLSPVRSIYYSNSWGPSWRFNPEPRLRRDPFFCWGATWLSSGTYDLPPFSKGIWLIDSPWKIIKEDLVYKPTPNFQPQRGATTCYNKNHPR